METTGNLAEQFKSLGYSTTAMHPNHATNWNRENVYKDFGFDQFLSINDFQGADTLRGMVTDQATYDKILELLDQNAARQFIFDVTMQNHSGYDTGLLPVDKQMHLNIDTTDLDAKTVEDGTLSDVDRVCLVHRAVRPGASLLPQRLEQARPQGGRGVLGRPSAVLPVRVQ